MCHLDSLPFCGCSQGWRNRGNKVEICTHILFPQMIRCIQITMESTVFQWHMESDPASWACNLGNHPRSCALNDPAFGLMFCCRHLESLKNFWTRDPKFYFAPGLTNYIASPVWNPEQSGDIYSSDFPGQTSFSFPRIPLNCSAINLQLPVGWWICILLQCNTFPCRGKQSVLTNRGFSDALPRSTCIAWSTRAQDRLQIQQQG